MAALANLFLLLCLVPVPHSCQFYGSIGKPSIIQPQKSSECDVVLSALHRLSKQIEKSNNCTLTRTGTNRFHWTYCRAKWTSSNLRFLREEFKRIYISTNKYLFCEPQNSGWSNFPLFSSPFLRLKTKT